MTPRRIVPRAEWGAAAPTSPPRRIATPTLEVWLHHSAGALDAGGNGVWWDDMRGIQRFHQAPEPAGRGWSDFAYSFGIGGGQVFEGRGFGIAGGHTKGRNGVSHGICLIGNYDHMVPTSEDLEAIAWLLAEGRRAGAWRELTGPHRDAPGAATSCCGRNLIDRIPELRRRAGAIHAGGTTTMEDDDMQKDERDALLGTAFLTRVLYDSLTPNGLWNVNPRTGEKVPAGTPGSKPVADVWRWAREAAEAARTVPALHGKIAGLTVALEAIAAGGGVSPADLERITLAAQAGTKAALAGLADELGEGLVATTLEQLADAAREAAGQ